MIYILMYSILIYRVSIYIVFFPSGTPIISTIVSKGNSIYLDLGYGINLDIVYIYVAACALPLLLGGAAQVCPGRGASI